LLTKALTAAARNYKAVNNVVNGAVDHNVKLTCYPTVNKTVANKALEHSLGAG
jgi:hypothetical protein